MSDGIFDDLGDMTNQSTKYPCLPVGLVEMMVAEATVEPSKKNPENQNLKLVLKTVNPQKDLEGNELNPGYQVTHWVGLSVTEGQDGKTGRTKDNIKRDLALLLETFDKKEGVFSIDRILGKTGSVKTKVENSDQFGQQTRIASFVPKK